MTDREIVRKTGREIVTDSNGIPITGQNIKMFKTPQYVTVPKFEEWKDEDSDVICVSIARVKPDGRCKYQAIPLEKFKEMLRK